MLNYSAEIQMQLYQLRQDYLYHLGDRLQTIENYWNQLAIHWDGETLQTFHRLVHTLTGSSATFGLQSFSEAVRHLEQLLQAWLTQGEPPSLAQQQEVDTLLAILGQQVVISSQFLQEEKQREEEDCPVKIEENNTIVEPDKRLIFLVEDEPDLAREIALQISYFGYEVSTFYSLNKLKEALAHTYPAVIIMDIIFPEGHSAGTQVIAALNQWRLTNPNDLLPPHPPVIFISTRDDLLARLQAVRAGGSAYFTKPVNVNELIDKLDQLLESTQQELYRILIVEDDGDLAEFHSLTLQQAGMVTQIVTNPLQILQVLHEFQPDLILMDIYMPSCNGLDIAAVIRQQSAYISIPIVFLSIETDLNKQLAALSLGCDDFLTKPIQPEHLISSVVSRAQRSATLRSLMVKDSLTGLLNHTKIKERLVLELKRAKQQKTSLAFAMIDIDSFKLVNDNYGHATGDRVIKSLARLLQQRLRPTDIVGRYGGEEFAVILVDTDGPTAFQVMNQIRQSFAQVQQWAEGNEFNVTFSCGIALFPPYQDAAQISKAADKALYKAKQAGRNQVLLSTSKVAYAKFKTM